MKRTFALVFVFLLVIFVVLFVRYKAMMNNNLEIMNFNSNYEIYNEDKLNGLDVATAINRAISNNEKYSVEKDSDGFYNTDDSDCVEVYVSMIVDEEGHTKTYRMESFSKVGMNNFISSFGDARFKCTSIKYNSNTGKVNSITFQNI